MRPWHSKGGAWRHQAPSGNLLWGPAGGYDVTGMTSQAWRPDLSDRSTPAQRGGYDVTDVTTRARRGGRTSAGAGRPDPGHRTYRAGGAAIPRGRRDPKSAMEPRPARLPGPEGAERLMWRRKSRGASTSRETRGVLGAVVQARAQRAGLAVSHERWERAGESLGPAPAPAPGPGGEVAEKAVTKETDTMELRSDPVRAVTLPPNRPPGCAGEATDPGALLLELPPELCPQAGVHGGRGQAVAPRRAARQELHGLLAQAPPVPRCRPTSRCSAPLEAGGDGWAAGQGRSDSPLPYCPGTRSQSPVPRELCPTQAGSMSGTGRGYCGADGRAQLRQLNPMPQKDLGLLESPVLSCTKYLPGLAGIRALSAHKEGAALRGQWHDQGSWALPFPPATLGSP